MDEEDLSELGESQIMSGVKDQQQRDVFAGTSQAEPLTYVRPSMNISKVIFASDGEDSDDEEAVEGDRGGQEKKDEATVSTLPRQLEEKPMKDSDMGAKAVPIPHLQVLDAVGQQQQQVSYEPRSSERSRAESVDMTTFKPVFVPRAERETQTRGDKRDGRGKDGKKRAKVIVSFEDDDDEDAALVIAPHLAMVAADKDKARKKKKYRKEGGGGWREGEGTHGGRRGGCGEKEPPQVVARFASTAAAAPRPLPRQPSAKEESRIEAPIVPSTSSNADGPLRGRKRAIDFL